MGVGPVMLFTTVGTLNTAQKIETTGIDHCFVVVHLLILSFNKTAKPYENFTIVAARVQPLQTENMEITSTALDTADGAHAEC